MLSITKEQIEGIKVVNVLQRLNLEIGLSQNSSKALQALVEASKSK